MPNNEDMSDELGDELGGVPKTYDELVSEEPERVVDLEELGIGKSLSEAEEETEHKTDLQAALKLLIPKFPDSRMNDMLQPIMVSRIFPENLLDLNYLLNMTQFEELERKGENLDFVKIVTGNQAATSIGYKGQGRIDILEVAGAAREQEMEKLAKDLGLGG